MTFLENKKIYNICVLLFFMIAVFIRVFRFGSVPGGFNQDEAMAAVDALALASHGTDRFGMIFPVHFTAWGYGQMSVLMSYIMAVFIKFFGLSEITARLPILLTSLSGIAVFFLFVRDSFGKKTALAALFLLAINPWHIMQSRWALDCNMFPHFILFSLFFLNKGISKKSLLYFSMFFFALCMYCYGIAFYSIPVLLASLCAYLLTKKLISIKDALICAAIYFFFAWPILAVVVINYFRLPTIQTPFFTIPFFEQSVRSGDLLFFSDRILRQAIENLRSLLDTSFFQFQDLPWNSISNVGPMYFISIPFIAVGVYALFRHEKTEETYSPGRDFVKIWLLVSIFAGIVINGANINRVNIIFYPLIISCVLGIVKIAQYFGKYAIPVIAAIFFGFFTFFSYSYFGTQNEIISAYFFDGFGQSLRAAEEHEPEKIYITSNLMFEDYAPISEILTLFYLKIDSEYYMSEAFREKYHFDSLKDPSGLNAGSSVFVIKNSEWTRFGPDMYEIVTYKGYGLAIPIKQ